MPEIPEKKKEKIVKMVQEMNCAFNNRTTPEITRILHIGPQKLYILGFRGEGDRWYDNYVIENNGDFHSFQKIEELIPNIYKGFGVGRFLASNMRAIALSLSGFLLTATICYLAITKEVKVDVIINFAAVVLGYIAGKSETIAGK